MQPKLKLLVLTGLLVSTFAGKWTYGQKMSQIFTASGTFTAPTGVTTVTVEAWGGGGGGGGASSELSSGGGGGGGAYKYYRDVSVTPGNSYNITVGKGGSGSTMNGNYGTASVATFDNGVVVTADGGLGGGRGTSVAGGSGGAGGKGLFNGGNGAAGYRESFDYNYKGYGGGGGSSAGTTLHGVDGLASLGGVVENGGSGGNGATGFGDGLPGLRPGGGGGGAKVVLVLGKKGGNGADGQVIISWSICDAPTINEHGQPTDQFITYGTNASFSVSASGLGALAYQWEVSTPTSPDWVVINDNNLYSGTTTAALKLTHPPVDLSGNRYRVVVSGCTPAQSIASDGNALLTVNKAHLVVSAKNDNKTYNGTVHQGGAGVTCQGFVDGETLEVLDGILSYSGSSQGAKDAGRYIITPGGLTAQNYDIQYMDGILNIDPRVVTVQAEPKAKVYGDNDPELTYELSEGELAGGDVLSGSLSRAHGENVGSYAIEQNTLTAGSNYELKFVSAFLVIEPRAITITADARNKVYGEPDPDLTYIITSGSLAFGDVFSGALGRQAGEDVGRYTIEQGTIALNENYRLSYEASDLSITPKAITVVAEGQRKIYGEDDPALIYSVTQGNLVEGDYFTGCLSREAGESVGEYNITQGNLQLSDNYQLVFQAAKLTIERRVVTITAHEKRKTYGEADPPLSYQLTYGSLVESDYISGELTRAAGHNVGDYAIQQGTLALSNNYDLRFAGASLTITARSLELTADAQSKTYGEADPALTYRIINGSLVSGDVFSGALDRVSGENVGTYPIRQGTLALSSNYNLNFISGEMFIYKRPISVTANKKRKLYGSSDPTLDYEVSSGSLVADDVFRGMLSRAVGEDVGSYLINLGDFTAGDNYELTFINSSLTIEPAPASIEVTDLSKTYNGLPQEATVKTTPAGLAVTVTYNGSATVPTNAGSYALVAALNNSNYTAANDAGTLVIEKANAAFNIVGYSGTYDGSAHQASGTASGVKGEDLTSLLTFGVGFTNVPGGNASWTFAGNDNYNEASGARAIVLSKASSSTVITITGAPFTYTGLAITPAMVSVTGAGGLNLTQTATYVNNINAGTATASYNYEGDENHEPSNDIEDFIIGKADAVISITPYTGTYDGTAHTASGTATGVESTPAILGSLLSFASSYTNYPGGSTTWSFAGNTNYKEAHGNTAVTINKANASISIVVGGPFTYDGAAKAVQNAPVSGVIINGTAEPLGHAAVVYKQGSTEVSPINAGTYDVYGAFTGSTNYNTVASYKVTTLTISKATLTITPQDASREYGEANPAFTGSYSGQKNGETFTVGGSTTATETSPVATYAIVPSVTGATLANYNVTPVNGTLTVTRRRITVTAIAKTIYEGQAEPNLEFTVNQNGLVGSDQLSGDLTRESGKCAGTYNILKGTVDDEHNPNYEISYVSNTFTIIDVSIDASASGNPVPLGSATILKAVVTSNGAPVVGVSVTFKLDGVIKGTITTNSEGLATYTVSELSVKVYQVEAEVGSGCASSIAYLPVYDPNAGFVTGGGWINSPKGALVAKPDATGKANFGFVAKYRKGSTDVEGETEFQFQTGDLKFKSSTYEKATLVISGSQASYRGLGTINGTGSYKFTLVAIDGEVNGGGGIDKFRIKITNADGSVVYDNQVGEGTVDKSDNAVPTTAISGGSIMIHTLPAGGKKSNTVSADARQAEVITASEFILKAFPNPSVSHFNVQVSSDKVAEKINVRVLDLYGRTVEVIPGVYSGQTITIGGAYRPGIYFVEMIQGAQRKQVKLLKQAD